MLPGEVDGRRVLRAFERLGFVLTTVRGSHHKLVGPDGRRAIVAIHGKISRVALLRVLKQVGVSEEAFERAL
jgi:predicted RNA binding protein YcfA (HicA-like mRNA interferase family)